MLELKTYQKNALAALEHFLKRVRVVGIETAWREYAPAVTPSGKQLPYQNGAFGDDIPCVCLRLPTGGGKTLLAAHAVARIGKTYCDTDAPVVLWLTPSDTIRTQTVAALNTAGHPYRQALERDLPQPARVLELDQLATVNPYEIGRQTIVLVATIQAFRVQDQKKAQRTVYAYDEQLEPHFQGLTPRQIARLDTVKPTDLASQPYLTTADLGKVKASLANFLHRTHPIIIVDEAHNNQTDTSFKTLQRLNPACVLELTATPVGNSNVLYAVSAQALKTEDMIKLPIVLAEHPTGWRDAVRDALLTRQRLETLAQREADYLRPLLLFQAQPKGGEATVEVLLEHLISPDGAGLDRNEIAVATGAQKELDGINLFDPTCRIRYVITVEALKEGWDCSFAYVLSSLQESRSAKDVEQLLGRVLRMPYARARATPELNRAYAHVIAASFAEAANQLTDRLVNNMGFEKYEAAWAVTPGSDSLFPDEAAAGVRPLLPDCVLSVPCAPVLPVPAALQAVIEIRPTSGGATVIVRGQVSEAVEDYLLSAYAGQHQQAIKEQLEQHHARQAALRAPAARGEPFAPLPQLCLEFDGELQPVERETLMELGEFDLLAHPVQLAGFAVQETVNAFEIDMDGEKVLLRYADSRQLHLNEVSTNATEPDLVRWLEWEVRPLEGNILPAQLRKYLVNLVGHLQRDRGFTLTALLRAKVQLAEAIHREIDRLRKIAIAKGFQTALPGMTTARLDEGFRYAFTFHPHRYPARPPYYSGRYRFAKHYYPMIHDLREKTASGQRSEEFICAQALDAHFQVKHWVRNVEGEERFSFWLPTATDYFYPDFVAELADGRVLAVEYKGEPYKTNDDSREKAQVGRQWEISSGGRCLFLMAVAADEQGRNVQRQIADKITTLTCSGSAS